MNRILDNTPAFTLTEAIIVIVIFGVIAILAYPTLLTINPNEKSWDTMSVKMAEYIEQATSEILLFHSSYDDFLRIKDTDNKTYFSIEDKGATERMAGLYRKYLSDVAMNVNTNREYFSEKIKDYNGKTTSEPIKTAYSNFFYVNDGMIIGFRFYESCSATEKNSNPPKHKGKFEVNNVCGSIFYDINAYKKPNKLGSDQYILPVYSRGIKYNND